MNEGMKEGMKEGMNEGMKEGMKEGKDKGSIRAALSQLKIAMLYGYIQWKYINKINTLLAS